MTPALFSMLTRADVRRGLNVLMAIGIIRSFNVLAVY